MSDKCMACKDKVRRGLAAQMQDHFDTDLIICCYACYENINRDYPELISKYRTENIRDERRKIIGKRRISTGIIQYYR